MKLGAVVQTSLTNKNHYFVFNDYRNHGILLKVRVGEGRERGGEIICLTAWASGLCTDISRINPAETDLVSCKND